MAVHVNLSTKQEVLEAINAASISQPVRIATLNPEFMLEAQHNLAFREALSQMTHCIIDGAGLYFALKLQGIKVERYAGSSLMADLLKKYQNGSKSFFLVGGPKNLANNAAQTIMTTYPKIQSIHGSDGGQVDMDSLIVNPTLISTIKAEKTDILFVGFGAPKQELWIHAAKLHAPAPVMIGVGGSFGFYTHKKRAPLWMRTFYLEWLYRGLTEKGHMKRVWRAVVIFPLYALRWIVRPEH